MPILLRNLTLSLVEDEETLRSKVAGRFALDPEEVRAFRIVRKSIDARKKSNIKFIYTVEFSLADEADFMVRNGGEADLKLLAPPEPRIFPRLTSERAIVIVGAGPAGLFAALRLAEYGLTAVIMERGKPVEERVKDVQAFWSRGELDPESNVQFGEGGAGTFSDGKLTTRLNDPNIAYVLEKLAAFGAPREILFAAKPHIGTDQLRGVIAGIRRHLLESGFTVNFNGKLTDFRCSGERVSSLIVNNADELPCDFLVLAPGHSARDTYEMLLSRGVTMESKPFAIGVRVEHPQELINTIQYGVPRNPRLPAAEYALAWNDPVTRRGVYSFCMCPGGVVVAGSSESGGVVTNGMSSQLRNSPYANSALVATVNREDFAGSGPLAGVEFQRIWERKAFAAGAGTYRAPAQNLMAFLGERSSGGVRSSYRPGIVESDLSQSLPEFVTTMLKKGLREFDRKMRGFVTAEATLTGVETRTSAPVRIVRGDDFQSVAIQGLYPTGEGAGYAGGIMSAALDGIRVADAIASRIMT